MTLTEQCKLGELPRGVYYIKYKGNFKTDIWHGYYWEDSWSENITEVLAPVPSYDEWVYLHKARNDAHEIVESLTQENKQLIKFLEEFNALDVAKENQQLKDLLERASYCIIGYRHNDHLPERVFYEEEVSNLLEEIDEVLK